MCLVTFSGWARDANSNKWDPTLHCFTPRKFNHNKATMFEHVIGFVDTKMDFPCYHPYSNILIF